LRLRAGRTEESLGIVGDAHAVLECAEQVGNVFVRADDRAGDLADQRRGRLCRCDHHLGALLDLEFGDLELLGRSAELLAGLELVLEHFDTALFDVDLGLLAAVTGEVALRPATAREAREITGSLAGGIPPFGFGHGLRTVMDRDLSRYQWIWAPAGSDSEVMRVSPGTLRMLCNAVVVPLVGSNWLAAPTPALAPSLALGVNP